MIGWRKDSNLLAVVVEAVRGRVEQLRLATVVEARHVGDESGDLGGLRGARVELALRPAGHERVDVGRVPDLGIPSESEEELGVQLVGLEVTDVKDPDAVCLPVDGEGHLLVDLEGVSECTSGWEDDIVPSQFVTTAFREVASASNPAHQRPRNVR